VASHDSVKSVKPTKETNVVATHEMAKDTMVKEVVGDTVKTEHLIVVEVKPVVVEVKNTPIAVAPVLSPSGKKEAYQNEIAEAINYYKNSPYHRFEPVMLQP
jgi:hypothetical protein